MAPKTVVTTHKNADFDALASIAAGLLIFPEAVPLLPKQLNPNVKAFLSLHKDLFAWAEAKPSPVKDAERLVVVDAGAWNRLSGLSGLRRNSGLEILIWDHHGTKPAIDADWFCCEELGANITLMLRCIKAENIMLSPIQATLFLAGLYEDTGHMSFPGTTSEDAKAAAYLLDNGADLNMLRKFLRPAYGQRQKNILFDMLKSVRRKLINGYSVSISRLEIKGHVDRLALVLSMYRDIVNVDAAFGIFNLPEKQKCMVIGRSDADGLNIGDIMRSLGGGGHPGAGSALLLKVNPEIIEQMIVELIEGNQQASVQISDLMSFPVKTVSPGTLLSEVVHIFDKNSFSGLPVVQDNKLVGMISRRDLHRLTKDSQLKSPIKAFMNRDLKMIQPGKSPLQAARIMVRNDIGHLPVVENNQIIGIVTRTDVMHYFYDLLPD
ncbi:MAG: CBS domain-containing protein [Desulfobacteraceae bacterium]|nr:CBS domain-containing protein [Desulfobacteraceae bacterium]